MGVRGLPYNSFTQVASLSVLDQFAQDGECAGFVATYCNTLQDFAVQFKAMANRLSVTSRCAQAEGVCVFCGRGVQVECGALQHTATLCNTL